MVELSQRVAGGGGGEGEKSISDVSAGIKYSGGNFTASD